MGKNNQYDLEFEKFRLEKTISVAQKELENVKRDNEGNEDEIISMKREMRDNSTHSISNLWQSQNFEDFIELSQYTNPITQKISAHETIVKRISALEKLINSPYFARIDFKFDDEEEFEKIYIGRSSLSEDDTDETYVYDWRSPIAGMFYRFVTGPAFYEAPLGRITGEINLKRQYEIKNRVLEYFFDAEVQILDEFLRKLLSQNASSQMKTIVETIQREQDIVIRDMENDVMMVQGVAGSGKTSIALHRAAYLMYQGLSSKLHANNIIIISPNSIFEQYISNVLPELGEDNVVSAVFDEILASILHNKHIQTRNQFLEILLTSSGYQNIMKSSIEFKTSDTFLRILERLIEKLPHRWRGDIMNLYKELFNDEKHFYHLAKGLGLPECIADIIKFTQENLCSKSLYYDDASAMAFFKLKLNGSDEYSNIKQVVIDEAQDYYPLHYEIFNLLFTNAKYTILGDINQTLEKQEDLSLYEQIGKMLNRKKSTVVTMDKSFRCTNEILNFSLKFIPEAVEVKRFNRDGYEPELHAADDYTSLNDMIASEIAACLEAGYKSIALICKTKKNCHFLSEHLKDKLDVSLINYEDPTDLKGVFIIPVYMSKGLEFDAVLVCDADRESYNSEDDKKLLYIACTRALHRLNLFCKGEISPLLQ